MTYGKGSSLYIANADGTGVREVFIADGSVFAPHLSVDGKRIRFTVSNVALNTTALWEVNSDGSNSHALLNNWQHALTACCGGWTADGRYYIFQVTETSPTTVTTLWALPDTANSDHDAPVQLTTGPMSFGNASMSRDNNRIWAIGVQPAGEAVKFDGASKKFVSLLSGISATDLDFSADGKWVTYVAVPDGTLWRCRTDSSDRRQLTSAPDRTALPRWSPDGNQIAYVSMQLGKPWKISTISRDGGAPQDILIESHGQIDANWSRDGGRIMFGYLRVEGGGNIRIVNLSTHEVTTVPGSDGLFSPRWSPEAATLPRSPSITQKSCCSTTRRGSSGPRSARRPAGAVSYPVWSADSKYIYFDDLVTDEESIGRVEVGSHRTEKVLKLEGIERYPGAVRPVERPHGRWLVDVRTRSKFARGVPVKRDSAMNRTLTSAMQDRETPTGEKLARPLLMLAFFALAACINSNTVAAQTQQTDSSDRKIVMRVEPEYPETLKRLCIGGIVRIEVTVDPSGKVGTAELLGGGPDPGQSAVRAVKQWNTLRLPRRKASPSYLNLTRTAAVQFSHPVHFLGSGNTLFVSSFFSG